ncbi:hypothetical protein SLA2020_241030 [Shorea laevis]
MGLGNLSRWTSFGKLLLGDAFSIFKFLCFLHVTDNYLVYQVFVSINQYPQSVNSWVFIFVVLCEWVCDSIVGFYSECLQAYGPSMIPTINPSGELLLSERISPKMGKVHPGDIVIVRSPLVPKRLLTKRLIAMEGERVTYVVDPKNSDTCNTIVVPKGHVWVEGDNIYESMDSRYFGSVPYGLITGRVFWRVFPFKDFGSVGPREK